MSNVKVCVRLRPLSSRERKLYGDSVCFHNLDTESFVFKDEKGEDTTFCFDRVFYQDSEQKDVYEFLAVPIIQDTVNAINGTILTYGQTGAGKTYSLEGPGVLDSDNHKKGLLPRVVDGLFETLKSSTHVSAYDVRISMVEIYMERVRDLLDVSKDNLQIREGKNQGIYLSGATEIAISDPGEALICISRGIANKAVGSTQMNMTSSRSHCLYTLLVQHESVADGRVRTGKLMLVDLAGSEKVEKTGAEGIVLEEAKTINKSLSALGNVINALTNGKKNHIPYRSSKLTRILEDALGGGSRTALLCCCSPSSSNAIESMSTLRFGTRAKLIKPPVRSITIGDSSSSSSNIISPEKSFDDESDVCETENGTISEIFDANEVDLSDLECITAQRSVNQQREVKQLIFEPVELKQTLEELNNEVKSINKALVSLLEARRSASRYSQRLQIANSATLLFCAIIHVAIVLMVR